ncbi:MAG: AMP-binding protein [Streptosporangiaceae bacterium]|jgi:acyl-CoA synthetase (AMP-forming)/AMP-acid ligase II
MSFQTDAVGSAEDHRQVLTCAGYSDAIRWQAGERLEQLFERRCDWFARNGQLAVDTDSEKLSYPELDARANKLARFLIRQGVRPGDRIGLLSAQAAVPAGVG